MVIEKPISTKIYQAVGKNRAIIHDFKSYISFP